MVQRIFILFTELPGLMRVGVLILVIGGALDVLYHTAPPGWAIQLNVVLGSRAVVAHLMTLFGMVVTLVGLFAHRASARIVPVEVSSPEGRSGAIIFDQPGAYSYICTYHAQDMKGTVNVVAR
jgi:hypothetical protein